MKITPRFFTEDAWDAAIQGKQVAADIAAAVESIQRLPDFVARASAYLIVREIAREPQQPYAIGVMLLILSSPDERWLANLAKIRLTIQQYSLANEDVPDADAYVQFVNDYRPATAALRAEMRALAKAIETRMHDLPSYAKEVAIRLILEARIEREVNAMVARGEIIKHADGSYQWVEGRQ